MDIYELIGFIIGDGNLYYIKDKKHKVYRLELTGNVDEDFDYFEKIQDFLYKVTKKKTKIFIRYEKKGRSLRIQFNNKEFVEKLISMGLITGKKTFTVKIPENMLEREKFFSILRGLFEADGCLYFSKSKKIDYPSYPRLEIRSSSPVLVRQIKNFLEQEGFLVYVKKPVENKTFSIQLSGERMLNLWIRKIGFVSLKNITKYKIWKAKGFYIPNTGIKHRLELCGGGTMATAVDFF